MKQVEVQGSSAEPATMGSRWLLPVVLALVGFAYWGGLGNGFVWLDQSEILDQQLIVDDWDGVLSLFANDRNNAGYQRPAYSLMHSLDWALFGPHPRGFLLSSLLLHLANVALVYVLLRRLSKSALVAASVAGLWGLHPVNSAVVGLIHSKADLLFLFGSLASSVFYLRTSDRPKLNGSSEGSSFFRTLNWFGAALCFALALFSKETALLFPVAVTSILFFPRLWGIQSASASSSNRSSLRRYVALLWILTLIVLAMRAGSLNAQNYPSELPLSERLLTFSGIYVGYLKKLCFPLQLSICDTVTRFSAQTTSVQFRLIASILIVIGLQVWAAIQHPWTRRWSLLFNLALLPVTQIVPILHFRADRFLYLPSLAFVGALVEGAQRIAAQWLGSATKSARMRRVGFALLAVVLLLFMVRIAVRLGDFRNDETLFGAELSRTPDYLEGLSVLGRSYDRMGLHEPAAELFRRALQTYPGRVSYFDRGGTAVGYAYNLLARGEVQAAREFLEGCRNQRFSAARSDELSYNLAVALFRLGDNAKALAGFQVYGTRHPMDASCHYFIGRAAMNLGQKVLARQALERYLELAPGAPDEGEVESWIRELAD